MTIKERLVRYPALQSEARALCNRLDDLQEILIIADPAELNDIERQIKRNTQEMKALRDLIARLPNPMEREILTLRYISNTACELTPWKNVALKMYGVSSPYRLRTISRCHREALMHLEEICGEG